MAAHDHKPSEACDTECGAWTPDGTLYAGLLAYGHYEAIALASLSDQQVLDYVADWVRRRG